MTRSNPRGRAARPDHSIEHAHNLDTEPAPGEESLLGEEDRPMRRRASNYQPDSWWSHAAYGIGSLALVAPFFIPGIPHMALFVLYFAIASAALVTLLFWGAIREGLDAWRAWRGRRTPGLL